uniref:Peptidase M50 domain-containing protein n=1 Tax=Chaetoceros debilis TaxID=122233 RepID=A0A7S3V6Z5_9STRA
MVLRRSTAFALAQLLCHADYSSAFATIRGHTSMRNEDYYTHSQKRDDNNQLRMAKTDDIEYLKMQAKKIQLEAEKLEAELNLSKISNLEKRLMASSGLEYDDRMKSINKIKIEVQILAKRVDPSLLSAFNFDAEEETRTSSASATGTSSGETADSSPKVETQTNLYAIKAKTKIAITESELTEAIVYFNGLPLPMRRTLAKAIDLDESVTSPAIIVLGLYELGGTLSDNRLNTLYKEAKNDKMQIKTIKLGERKLDQDTEGEVDNPFNPWGKPNAENQLEVDNMVDNVFPRAMRKEGTAPTSIDVDVLTTNVLGKDTFQASAKPQKISGGYVIRGKMAANLKDSGDELIRLLDEKIDDFSPQWNERYQVSYMTDPTPTMLDDVENLNGSPVLVVHSRDMTPSTGILLNSGVSAVSIFFAFVFIISTFGQNDVVMQRLTEANNNSNYDLTWFNQLITPLLLSLGVSQFLHESAHLFVAKKDGFKMTPPTILPSVALPWLSFQNRLKTSPKNLSQLFDFASAGPAVGMASSIAFLLIGLQLTVNMDATQLQYAPSVPVGFLNFSSLGGNIVDYVLSGGSDGGIILKQDPNVSIPLHPLAIGGFAGMMINALDLIPLAGTDGGRMSLALLGRPGHLAFSGVIFLVLFGYSLFAGHADIILGYLFINTFTQKDLEIPSRNEVDDVGLGKAAIALLLWSTAILTLVPAS